MKIGVTGGSGLVGSHLMGELQSRGHIAQSLPRTEFKLGEAVAVGILCGFDGLVHCAYDFHAFGWDEIKRVNVDGSITLLKAAIEAGVKKLIFVSSIAAFDGCKSLYGRGKLEVEAFVRDVGGVTVRPGLVYGDTEGRGMFGSLARAVRMPIVPVFGDGSQHFYLAHVQDLAVALADAIERYDLFQGRTVIAANPEPIAFRDLLNMIARGETGRRVVTVPVPALLGLFGLKALEAMGLRPRFRSDSLVSMMTYDREPDFAAARELGLRFRSFSYLPRVKAD